MSFHVLKIAIIMFFSRHVLAENFHDCASPHDKISESIPLGGSSSVGTEILDFIAAKRRGKYGKIMDSKMIGGETERLKNGEALE